MQHSSRWTATFILLLLSMVSTGCATTIRTFIGTPANRLFGVWRPVDAASAEVAEASGEMVIAVSVFPSSLSVPGFGRELAETIGVTDIVASGEVHLADGRSYLFAVPRPAERDATSWGVCVLEPVLLVQESRIVLRHADEWLAELREGSSEESDHLVIIRVGLTDETLEFVRMSERGGVTLPPRPVPLAVVPHGR